MPPVTEPQPSAFDDLLRYVEEDLAFATSHYNDSYLDRRITARMRRTGSETYEEYRELLETDPEEGQALLDALSINVTGFFRNPAMWSHLRTVLRDVVAETRRVRLWSAACSDGREAYSLAMLALDDGEIDHTRVSIVATDINEAALRAAREGVYRSTRTTDIAEELSLLDGYESYVDVEDGSFAVRPVVRDLVEFDRHDLIRDDPFGTFDLVLCRNLFIYIDPAYKEPILDAIDESLAAGGYLVIGMAETLPNSHRERYDAVTNRSRIHRRVD